VLIKTNCLIVLLRIRSFSNHVSCLLQSFESLCPSQIFLVEKTSIPCVFEDDLRDITDMNAVNGDLNSNGLNVTLDQGEINDMFEYNFEVCSVGVNYRYVYELMYGECLNNM